MVSKEIEVGAKGARVFVAQAYFPTHPRARF